jgi:putative hydrolase of HD superfamily
MQVNEQEAIIGFLFETGHLKRTPRSGWLMAGVPNAESVAEHSFRVGVIAYVIATLEGANADRAAALGLFHDVPESRTGDIPSVGKKGWESTRRKEFMANAQKLYAEGYKKVSHQAQTD